MPVNGGRYNLKIMYWDIYAPWEHYPKTLHHEEMMNPMLVIADFFSSDSVKGHKRHLKTWRYYVINNESYPGGRHGPGNLLFDYDLNLKLLEAVYLLYCHYRNYAYRQPIITEEQLSHEKETWSYFPNKLSAKEIQNPYQGIRKVFKKISPQQYRDYLHEWLHSALYIKADVEGLTAGNVLLVYDNLVKLYSLAWLIYQRETAHPHEKVGNSREEIININQEIGEIRPIHPKPTPAEKLGLEELKKMILERFPSVEMMVHLGTHPKHFTYYLLILVSDEETTPEHEISNKIEDHCKFLANVHTIVHKSGSAKFAISSGKRFWCLSVGNGSILYQLDSLEMPECPEITGAVLLERAQFHWERWGKQGNEFLKGVEIYRADENYRLAAFLLHQAVESILKGIIQAVLGYRVQMHNLSRLLRLTLLFTDDLIKVFELDTEEGVQLFSLLQKSYSQSRYNNVFEPDQESVKLLAWRVGGFYKVAEKIYQQYSNSLL